MAAMLIKGGVLPVAALVASPRLQSETCMLQCSLPFAKLVFIPAAWDSGMLHVIWLNPALPSTLLQAVHGEQFVLVAKVSPQLPFDPAAPPAPVQGIPVVAETTLVLVSLDAVGH